MKKYIDFNTEKRMNAANDFEKDFFKLMINSVYGKIMDSLWKRINVSIATEFNKFKDVLFNKKIIRHNEKDLLKYTSKPTYFTLKFLVKILLLFMKINQF